MIDATEAERIGYLNRLWPTDSFATELASFVDELAHGPTRTYAAWKLAVNRAVLLELDSYTDYERGLANLAARHRPRRRTHVVPRKAPTVYAGR